ncbi:alpha-hydroxy acid oxidase [Roseibium sp. SCP14]|uniref:alpha-hydroxy acid oxidase n=1 Tax=Roseibium sp. SCP14 TaxID=3141375 RepID=UPI0033397003
MTLSNRYPSVADLARKAKRRMPHFAWEYLDSGTGAERLVDENRSALDAIRFVPDFCKGAIEPVLETELFGKTYSAPFGIAPVGMSGLMWPGAELILARAARDRNIPYCLSTVACETPEEVAPLTGGNAWFQLYPPPDAQIRKDLVGRAWSAGITTLVVTIDVPIGSRRERQLRAGLTVPPRITPLTLWHVAKRPVWALATLVHGQPRFRTLTPYFDASEFKSAGTPVGRIVGGRPDWSMIEEIRSLWQGTLIVKGVMSRGDAERSVACGADGLVVSNHGGRQFDGGPSAISLVPGIREQVGDRCKILFDSGIRGGLDVVRALSMGADFCLLGRAFLYGVAALGARGAAHTYDVLREDLRNNMIQLGAGSIADLKNQTRWHMEEKA